MEVPVLGPLLRGLFSRKRHFIPSRIPVHHDFCLLAFALDLKQYLFTYFKIMCKYVYLHVGICM